MRLYRLLFFIGTLLHGAQSAQACVMQGADIIHCAPKALNDLLFAPFSSACNETKFLEEARSEYEDLSLPEGVASKSINGKVYRGKGKDLETFNEMISHGRMPQKVTNALESCDEVFCALEKIFDSKEAAYRALSIARDSGYVVSLEQDTADDYIWSVEDLRDLSYATNILPKELMDQRSMDRFKILPEGESLSLNGEELAGLASSSYNGNGAITFKNFDRKDKNWPAMVIIHEMAHHFDYPDYILRSKNFFESSGFTHINGWQSKEVWTTDEEGRSRKKLEWSHKPNACFLGDYAGSSPQEDFAEAVANFIGSPYRLKKKCKEIYAFIKDKVFKGEEYLDRGLKGRTLRLLEEAPEMKRCLVADYQGLSYSKENLYLERWTQNGGRFNFETHDPITLELREECMSKLKAQMGPNQHAQACVLREASEDMEADIKLAFEEKWGEEFRSLVSENYSAKRFISSFDKCVKEKNLTTECLLREGKQALQNKGFSPPEIAHFRGELDHKLLEGLGFDSKKAFASCIDGRPSNLIKYLNQKNNSATCYWEITDVLQREGIKYDKYDIAFSFKNAVFNKENLAAMEHIKKEFLDKGKDSVLATCDGDVKSCIAGELKNHFGFDPASAESLAQAIEGAL